MAEADSVGLHSLRRGAAQALHNNGAHLSTILLAGGWRSSAFRAYMDLHGLEKEVVSASLSTLIDLDEEEEGAPQHG